MKDWKYNPKTKGSGIITCIPQKGRCPNNCKDCFFQSGRSYLEPLEKNLPHVPPPGLAFGRIVRMNDGNDSAHQQEIVEDCASTYDDAFFNTCKAEAVGSFDGPVVLTINPGNTTDTTWYRFDDRKPTPENLMFVRIRTNTWNLDTVVKPAVEWYTSREVPVVLTFMAYYERHSHMGPDYIFRERTINSYYAITTAAWEFIMSVFKHNTYVYSCGKIEGELGNTKCSRCGNCIREYYNTKERLR